MQSNRGDRWIDLGVLGRPRGLLGALWFRAYNDHTESVTPGRKVRVTDTKGVERMLLVADMDVEGKGIVLRLAGVDGREAAEALVNAKVALRRKDLPPLEEGEYYHCDLPGLSVLDPSGAAVGEVVGIEAYPTVDALRVKVGDDEHEVPVTGDFVLAMDLDAGTVTVDLVALRDA